MKKYLIPILMAITVLLAFISYQLYKYVTLAEKSRMNGENETSSGESNFFFPQLERSPIGFKIPVIVKA